MAQGYVGKGIGRTEGLQKAQGRALYAGDYSAPDMLHLHLVRAPLAHGRLLGMEAPSMPKGAYFFTAKDIPVNVVEDIIEDQPVLAYDRIRFYGEPVAIVAAGTAEEAKRIADSVRVHCDAIPVVNTARDALEANAPHLHEGGNLLQSFQNEHGCVADGFQEAALILEDDFFTPVQDHACMEPEASFSFMDEEGRLNSFTSTQNVFHDQRMICRALSIPAEKVRVTAATVGGGFGGKDGHTAQIFTALVSLKTKRPARLVFSREDSLQTTYKRHSADMHVKMGFAPDGAITAFEGRCLLDTGAYAGLGPAVLGLFTEHFAGPYKTPNAKLDVKLLYTNKPPAHAMRGFGAPQGAFATETLISRAATLLKVDQIEIRRRNALRQGDVGSLGQTMEHCVGLLEALDLVEHSALYKEYRENPEPGAGYGVAAGFLSCGLGKNIPDSATVEIKELDGGRFGVCIGMVDIGQGSRTALHAMAADALQTPMENIDLLMADTGTCHDCGSTAGSRSTFIAGGALLDAARQYHERKVSGEGGPFIGKASFPESKSSFATPGFPHAMYTFIAQAVKLRVNPITGQVQLCNIYAATEAGRIINPLSMTGQIQGGVAMSLGYALGEDCRFEDGILQNSDYSTYLLPTAMDVPPIACGHVEAYEQSGPFGVKGAAEVATVSIAPAIGAAITQVSGAQLNRLPYDIESIFIHARCKPNTKTEENP